MSKQSITQELLRTMFDYRGDGHLVRKVKMGQRGPIGSLVGYVKANGRRHTMIHGAGYQVHRLIFLWHHGWVPAEVDHINRNPTDNRVENLRPADKVLNGYNRKRNESTYSGVKGVCREHRWGGKWRAACTVNKKRYFLGNFQELADAEAAVKAFRSQHHGEFACHG